ncbi:MAG: tetratricopeptide repeat protein, partial [Phycisphaerales bacterium]
VQIGVGVVAVLALLVALNVGGWRERLFSRTPAGTISSLAVLPLANLSGDRDQEYFADGMTGELNTALGKIRALTVISRMSVMRYKDTDKTPPDIARELNVDALVEGTVTRFGDRVRITANLIKGATSEQLWGDSYERELRDILALQNEVARAIAKEIKVKLTPQEQVRLTTTEQVNPEAYEAYLKGRHWWNKRTPEGLNKSLTLFRQAISLDPNLALGYAGIADAYVVMGSWNVLRPHEAYPEAKKEATKGVEIDETLAEAHVSLAAVAKNYDWDFSGAEREFIRAIQLNPGYATAYQWYAEHLAAMGRHEEAVAQMERALELDPLSLIIHVAYGRICYYARRYELAIDHCHKALQLDPNFTPAHLLLSFSYVQKGMFEEAVAASQKAKLFSGGLPLSLASLGYAHAVAGNRDEALSILAQLTELSKQTHVTADNLALIHIGLGEKDQAFGWLARAAEERSSYLASLNTEPVLDSLRADPRFDDLVRRVGMEPAPRPPSTFGPPAGKIRLAVRPFNNLSANPEQEYFCDGMTEELISQLGRLHPEGLEVIGRGSSMHYKGSDKTSGQVGRELDVDYVLEGSVRRAGDRIRILAGLTRVSNQTQLWTEDYDDRSDADVFDIQADVARRIA